MKTASVAILQESSRSDIVLSLSKDVRGELHWNERGNRAIGGRLGQRGIDKEGELSESCHACMPALEHRALGGRSSSAVEWI